MGFKESQNELYVNEGDNLIFICPRNRTFSQNIFWTDDPRVLMKCNETLPIKVIKLLDCFGNDSIRDFVLKVSQFPEIASLPSFHYDTPVHFVAQSVICHNNNFRLSVRLSPPTITGVGDRPSNHFQPKIRSRLFNYSRKSSSNLNSALYDQIQNEQEGWKQNLSSSTYRTPRSNGKERWAWTEYRFLLLPATLAFFTLVGMQIVLCGFWLSSSFTNKFQNCFNKSKHIKRPQPGSNHKETENELQSPFFYTPGYIPDGEKCLCWSVASLTNSSSVIYTMKNNYSNSTHFNYRSQSSNYDHHNHYCCNNYQSQNYQYQQRPLLLKYSAKNFGFDKFPATQIIPDTLTVLSNHFCEIPDVRFCSNQKQTVTQPAYTILEFDNMCEKVF
ncbi:unnamed protein product [Trichobilharzia szidati]|nr:unnamed protein product [Trichobilharzia szidati]